MSARKYAETVLQAGEAVGVSSSAVSRKLVDLTATKLKVFQERSLGAFMPFALFLDTIHRGGEAFLVALGVDVRTARSEHGSRRRVPFHAPRRRRAVPRRARLPLRRGDVWLERCVRDLRERHVAPRAVRFLIWKITKKTCTSFFESSSKLPFTRLQSSASLALQERD